MLTGHSHHSVGMGSITEAATGAPGYSSVLPKTTAAGPITAWPTGGGGFGQPTYAYEHWDVGQPPLYESLELSELPQIPRKS
jgi:arylsulfatase